MAAHADKDFNSLPWKSLELTAASSWQRMVLPSGPLFGCAACSLAFRMRRHAGSDVMGRLDHIRLMAQYNGWMNQKLYAAAAGLSHEALLQDRGAFFHSILGTLNHIAVGDTVWLKRFTAHPAGFPLLDALATVPVPASLQDLLYPDLAGLADYRRWLDTLIPEWIGSIQEHHLDQVLAYRSMAGVASERSFYGLLIHFFNHQTHHRGQASTLLSQVGIDIGPTDLLLLVPDALAA
jgi:uncharacterized damage-inducible protein DinB